MRNTNYLSSLLAASLLAVTAPNYALAQTEKPPAALVDSLFKTYGGKDYIRSINGMRLQFAGEIHNPWQSRSSTSTTPISTSYHYVLDWAGQRQVAHTDFNFPGGHRIQTREIKSATQSLIVDMTTKSVAVSTEHIRLPTAIRFHPLLLMRELARDDSSVRHGGTAHIEGKTYDVLSLNRKDGPAIDVLLTRGDVRIGGVRYRSWAADDERATATQLFSGEGQVAPHYPTLITGSLKTSRVQKWQYRISEATVNPVFGQQEFDAPRGFSAGSEAISGSTIALGKSAHLVRGLQNDDYNALVLEFKDFLAIVEAPIDRSAGEELRKIAKLLAPAKPIKYLILSHHHADHIGGASALIESGTEVIAPASAKPYIEAVMKAGKATPKYKFHGLEPEAKYSIGDETLRVDVFALRGNPHADGMLFVHLPQEKLVFQADMFFFHQPDHLTYPLNERGFAFYHSLLLLGLDFTTVAGTHGVPVTRQTVQHFIRN
jgi:glyoxylase-like metal-dependent hydrolase (beta-lactamase superfamily II)